MKRNAFEHKALGERLKELLCFNGRSKEEWDVIRGIVRKDNMAHYRPLTLILAVAFGVLTPVASIVPNFFGYSWIFPVNCIGAVLLYNISTYVDNVRPQYSNSLCLLLESGLYFALTVMDTFSAQGACSVGYMVMVIVLPLLFHFRLYITYSLIFFWDAVFLVCDRMTKTPRIFDDDLSNLLVFTFVSLVLTAITEVDRAKNYLDQVTISRQKEYLDEQMKMFSSMTEAYTSVHYVDPDDDRFEEVSSRRHIHDVVGSEGSAREQLGRMVDTLVAPESRAVMKSFADLSTLNERMRETDTLSELFMSQNGWVRASWIVSDRRSDGTLKHVFFATRNVNDEVETQKRAESILEEYNKTLESDVWEKTKQIKEAQDKLIFAIAEMIEGRDLSTGGHIKRTSTVVNILTRKMAEDPENRIPARFYALVAKAAPMHDLGKITVDDAILRKAGRFEKDEYEQMKQHAPRGGDIVRRVLEGSTDREFAHIAEMVARYHHERFDGKGYPEGLSGTDIPLEARIMAVADVYDALVSKRCYKEGFSFDKAFDIIEEGMGTQFDPALNKYFVACRSELEDYYRKEMAE